MARIRSLLAALAISTWRGVSQIASFSENNFFLIGVVLLLRSGPLMAVVLGLAVMIPMTANPLRAIPPDRLGLLPLDERALLALRVAAFWMNPVALTAVLVAAWFGPVNLGLEMFGVLLVSQFVAPRVERLFQRAPQWDPAQWIPELPGVLGPLVRKNLREMAAVLDFWISLVLALISIAWRVYQGGADPEMARAMSILIVIAGLGTHAQCLFGLDARSGRVRYRLMPLRGWRILLAKDIAFLAVAIAFTLLLSPLAGLAASLGALAVGHHLSVLNPLPQHRWRFTKGSMSVTFFQAVAGAGSAVAVSRENALWLAPLALAWAVSLWWYGLLWEESWQDR